MRSYNCCWPGDSCDAGMTSCGPRCPCCHEPQGIVCFIAAKHVGTAKQAKQQEAKKRPNLLEEMKIFEGNKQLMRPMASCIQQN